MKKIYLSICIAISTLTTIAQDVITKKTGEQISALVTKVSDTHISYKRFENRDGPVYKILKAEVSKITYEKGFEDNFEAQKQLEFTSLSSEEKYELGYAHSTKFYKAKGPMWGTFIGTVVFAPAGLVVGIVNIATPPRIKNLKFEGSENLADADYKKGFKTKARRRKFGKTFAGFGLGIAANLVVFAALYGY